MSEILDTLMKVLGPGSGILALALFGLGWLFTQNQKLHARNLEILEQVLPLVATFPAAVERLTQATAAITTATAVCASKRGN
jgi:hypothetical protein